ncbi:MAG: DUF934 domain-containing protein [Luminiphilus sp.]|nr:DUF934 domain-containing protein [Luminiphilus sp.]
MTVVIDNQGRFGVDEVLEFVDIDASIASDDLDEFLKTSAIRIVFGSCADGRFLTLGRQLRLRGYSGHIRATGPLVPDQFPMALKLGIDSVEISTEHAARCTEDQWVNHAARTQDNYQRRLTG